MNRFNYLAADKPRLVTFALGKTIAIDNRVRGPLATLVAIVLVTMAITLVQLARLHAAERAYSMASARLTSRLAPVAEIESIRARISVKQRLAAQIAQIDRSSLLHAEQLAWIGNNLPPDTWLRTLRYENGTYSLDGTARRATAIGAALLALHDNDGSFIPRLVSLRADTTGTGPRIRYSLQLVSQP